MKKVTRTRTSSFGAKSRISHDASQYYNSRLYAGQPDGQPEGEHAAPPDDVPSW